MVIAIKALSFLFLNILAHVCKQRETGCKLQERDCKRRIDGEIYRLMSVSGGKGL